MQEDFVLNRNNSFTGFTTSYIGKRLRFIFDLRIEVKINSHWEVKYRKAFLHIAFLQYFLLLIHLKLVSYILDIR